MTDWYKIKRVLVWQGWQEKQIYPASRLPSAYQEVEYIQSSWTQYFVVWNTFKTSYKIVLDFQMVTIWWDYIPLWVNSPSPYKKYWINAYWWYFKVVSWWNAWSNSKSEDTNRHTLTIDKNTVTVDGTDYSINYVDYTYSYWVWVFAYKEYDAVRYHSSNKLYSSQIYDENWDKIYDLVPCYRKSDNVIGMYDLVNNQFYTNQWTGIFAKWPDVS